VFFFFFSSRRRHTRFSRDWSSDVCSSDLVRVPDGTKRIELVRAGDVVMTVGPDGGTGRAAVQTVFTSTNRLLEVRTDRGTVTTKIGRASCRERVEIPVGVEQRQEEREERS